MRYTRYFGLITKEQGTMNLSIDQFQRMMNIVHIEGVLAGLTTAKEANKSMDSYHKYDILLLKEKEVLAKLAGNLEPNLLLKEMVQHSE